MLRLVHSPLPKVHTGLTHSSAFQIEDSQVSYKSAHGTWMFELYGTHIMKTTFRPHGYLHHEQISNAVIQKPTVNNRVVVHEQEQVIEFGSIAKISLQDDKYAYQFGNQENNRLAEYFSLHECKGFRFQLEKDEQIFGGGERALPMNRRGYRFNLYNSPAYGYAEGADNLNFSIPFIISSKGYGLFFDNPSRGYLDIGKTNAGVLEAGFTSGELTYYIINGNSIDEILRHYTYLVGRQPIPARWVLGNLMSRFGYRSEEQVKQILAKMKEEDFPVDAVIFDLFWFGDSIRNCMGNLDWANEQAWPDPARMLNDLKEEGIKTVLITEPYVLMGTKSYSESKPYHAVSCDNETYTLTNFYFGFGGLLDLFRKDTQDWFWTKYKKQIENGVTGWWGDLGEPETHPHDMYHNLSDLGYHRLFRADEVHNIFGHYWNKMLFEKYQEEYPDTRLFNLNRSGYAGSQRYGIFPWSGDVHRNWSGLRAQLPVMLGMSISGVPYIHADAGGFAMGERDPELYTRWLQFATFTPVFRPHGTALGDADPFAAHIESEPVFFPDPYKSIVRRYIQMRYDLLPYNYTLAFQQLKEGKPLARPLFYYDLDDSNLLKAEDQFMWGDHLLVAPVLHKGTTERRLYLPKGEWYKFNSNVKIRGGQWITELVDINNIPLYVKAGAFIPTTPGLKNTEAYSTDALNITYYPGQRSSSFTMYDDDGKTNESWKKSAFELLYFEAAVEETRYRIRISSNGGSFENKPVLRKISMCVPALNRKPTAIKINDRFVPVYVGHAKDGNSAEAVWNPATASLQIACQFAGTLQSIEIIK
ncbi:MAG: glycoside hydrolase family 31 protein [Williamsia sp.]|nr:glycoside hydrolase family 31 protein [Williamsia sp.]